MDKRIILLVALILIVSSLAFAADDVNLLKPASGDVWYVGTEHTIDFNIADYNADTHAKPIQVRLYYSEDANTQQHLIVYDANLDDGVDITCLDYNFWTTTACSYTWLVPEVPMSDTYYVDINYGVFDATNKYVWDQTYSGQFTIDKSFDRATCALADLMNVILIAAAILAMVFIGIMGVMTQGDMMDKMKMVLIASGAMIVVLIVLYIVGILLTGMCPAF